MHEETFGRAATVIYGEADDGTHGNFLPESYRRILRNASWQRRLEKSYTGSAWVPRAEDRRRRELECCTSSDALLMNVFCYPRVLHRIRLCALLGIESGLQPEFGVRANLPMHRAEIDRTELDMRLGSLLVESKLSEAGFGTASRDRLFRYVELSQAFDTEALPWGSRGVGGYQLIRGALAAHHAGGRYLLLWDERRADLRESWFRVLSAIQTADLRHRMLLVSWQELAAAVPERVRGFLATKYGIHGSAEVAKQSTFRDDDV